MGICTREEVKEMATETVGAPVRVFNSILPALAVPARFILFGASVFACVYAWLAMLSLADQYNGGVNVFFMIVCGILTLIAIIITIALLSDGPQEQAFQPAFALAIVHWFLIFIFMVVAGETYPLPQERSPWVEPSGRVYYQGQEAPRYLFGGTRGTHIDSVREFTATVRWNDVAEASRLRLRMSNILTFESRLTNNDDALETAVSELIQDNSSMQTLNQRLWDSAHFTYPSNEEMATMAQARSLPDIGTVYPSEVQWATELRLTQNEQRAELTTETEDK